MRVCEEISFNDLCNKCWAGATDTLETIQENDYENELMSFLEEVFYDEVPTLTEINDLLWFDSEYVFESIGLDLTEEDEEEDEEEEDEDWDD